MNALSRLFVGLVALALVACATFAPVIEGDSVQARAGNAIAQAEIALTKGYRLVTDQAATGVLLKTEVEAALRALDSAAKVVDEARDLYKRGVFDGAIGKVLDADKALSLIENELAKKLKDRRRPVSSASAADADQVCRHEIFQFLVRYHQLKAKSHSEQDISRSIEGHPDAIEAAKRFVHADFQGDKVAAGKALTDVYDKCVAVLTKPETVI